MARAMAAVSAAAAKDVCMVDVSEQPRMWLGMTADTSHAWGLAVQTARRGRRAASERPPHAGHERAAAAVPLPAALAAPPVLCSALHEHL